jgi:hypothetical protein
MGCGRIDYGQSDTGAPECQQRTLKFDTAAKAMDIGLGSSTATAPVRNRPLRIRVDYGYPMPVPHRSDCNTNGERTLAAAALLRSQYDSLHNPSDFKANDTAERRWQRF